MKEEKLYTKSDLEEALKFADKLDETEKRLRGISSAALPLLVLEKDWVIGTLADLRREIEEIYQDIKTEFKKSKYSQLETIRSKFQCLDLYYNPTVTTLNIRLPDDVLEEVLKDFKD